MRRVASAAAIAASAWTVAHLRSPAVRSWRSPDLPIRRLGPLSYRIASPDVSDIGIVLLHGLVATGDVFGATPELLGAQHRVVVPDLLGFGRSLDEGRGDFSTAAHLAALDALIDHELGDRRIRIGAHSMGSALALRWAAANPHRVERVVCVGAPMWPDADSATAALGALGPMGKSLVLDDGLARAVCSFNCRHRSLAGLLSAAVTPRWPIAVARQASLHTWPAYIAALEEQIINCPWSELLATLAEQGVPVHLIKGDRDTIGDVELLDEIATWPGVDVSIVDGDHTLPAADPHLLANHLSRTAGESS